jgi:iron-sulfur cluster repair protein YtfE (RIC family)
VTVTEPPRAAYPELLAVDVYRNIHKAIRAELSAVAVEAGRVDPADRAARESVATRVHGIVDLLTQHAAHEDRAVQPYLDSELPTLAEQIAAQHESLEPRTGALAELADAVAAVPAGKQRAGTHHLYLELGRYMGDYLAHQDHEERVVLPALDAAVGPEGMQAIHHAIVSSISPAERAASLAVMLPAQNIEDHVELFTGLRAGAPPEAFAGVWGLAGSVLPAADLAVLAGRLGLG